MSLRRRLLAGILAVAAVLVLTNAFLARTFESYLLDRVDRQLVDVARRPFVTGLARPQPGDEQALSEYFIAVGDPVAGSLTPLTSAFADENDPPPRIRRRDVLERLSGRRAAIAPEPFTAPADSGDGSWRLIAVPNRIGGVTVIGLSLDEIDDTISRVRVIQIGGTVAVLAALGVVAWWMLRLGVDPIEHMAAKADEIAAGDLTQRVDHPGEDTEAGRLGVAFNSMIDRIEEAFRAREASEAQVRRFAADASHELRTPLTSIQGYAELWRAGGLRDDEALADAMRRVEQEARRMGALVDDLLLLARLDQKRPLDRAEVRLDTLVEDAVSDARAVEPDRPISVDVVPATVMGDELRLRQVVGNLLSNARVHTPPGTPVRVTVRADGASVALEVADEGPGLDAEAQARVFERFYRGDPSRDRRAGGSGLGLSIVSAVAEAHGGRARIDSAPGAGARFTVELPQADPATS